MDLQNKKPAEIQEEIYKALAEGVSVATLKAELSEKGHHSEAYYFTSKAARERAAAADYTASAGTNTEMSSGQIIGIIITVVILILRIARCASH